MCVMAAARRACVGRSFELHATPNEPSRTASAANPRPRRAMSNGAVCRSPASGIDGVDRQLRRWQRQVVEQLKSLAVSVIRTTARAQTIPAIESTTRLAPPPSCAGPSSCDELPMRLRDAVWARERGPAVIDAGQDEVICRRKCRPVVGDARICRAPIWL